MIQNRLYVVLDAEGQPLREYNCSPADIDRQLGPGEQAIPAAEWRQQQEAVNANPA